MTVAGVDRDEEQDTTRTATVHIQTADDQLVPQRLGPRGLQRLAAAAQWAAETVYGAVSCCGSGWCLLSVVVGCFSGGFVIFRPGWCHRALLPSTR